MKKKVVSFLVSGQGSNFQKIANKIINGEINADPGILISNNKTANALKLALEYGMKSFFVDPRIYKTRQEHEKKMLQLLKDSKTDIVVAAGYMRVLTPYFIKRYRNKIINIHPALLPSFPGVEAQKQAFEKGVKITGCTAHFIDEGTDTGPIILQMAVPVFDSDTLDKLSARILKEEHKIFPESVKLYCEDRLKVIGKKVYIKR